MHIQGYLFIGVSTDTYVIYQSILEKKKTYEWLICDS